jgi:DNA-binding response OmpR family regulator
MEQGASSIRVLLVEDDQIVREIVSTYLLAEGISVRSATSVETGIGEFRRGHFDLVIADINLPDGLGFDLIRALRQHRDCAVIYLTSRADHKDRVRGLETGGDDYLIKPVHLAELSARIHAIMRRYRKSAAQATSVIDFSGSTLDLMRRELADKDGRLAPLTRGEFDIFSALIQARPVSLDRDYLLEVLATAESSASARTIDVLISRIRTKIEPLSLPFRIVTTRGSGYRIEGNTRC